MRDTSAIPLSHSSTRARKKRPSSSTPRIRAGESLLRIDEVERRTSLSYGSVDQLMRAGSFPLARRIGDRVARWIASEVDGWVRDLPSTIEDALAALPPEPAVEAKTMLPTQRREAPPMSVVVPIRSSVSAVKAEMPAPPVDTQAVDAENVEVRLGRTGKKRRKSPRRLTPEQKEKALEAARAKNAVRNRLFQERCAAFRIVFDRYKAARRAQIRAGSPVTFRDWQETILKENEVDPSWREAPPDRRLDISEVAELVLVPTSVIRKMSRDGRFPKPNILDDRCFFLSEIEVWKAADPASKTRAALQKKKRRTPEKPHHV